MPDHSDMSTGEANLGGEECNVPAHGIVSKTMEHPEGDGSTGRFLDPLYFKSLSHDGEG